MLGASLLDPKALDQCLSALTPESFYAEAHRRVFEACATLREATKPVDIMTVGTWLKDRERIAQVGGLEYLTELVNFVPTLSAANVAAYAQTVADKYRLRRVIATCQTIAAEGYGDVGEVDAFLDSVDARIYAATSARAKTGTVQTMRQAVKGAFARVQEAAKNPGMLIGTRTGLTRYDSVTGGLHDGELTIVAGRPGQGKTAWMMGVAVHVAQQDLGVWVASLEMPNEQLALRSVCSEARVDLGRARTNAFQAADWPELTAAAVKLSAPAHLYLDDDPTVSLMDLRSRLREYRRIVEADGKRLGLVCIDYLQLVRARGGAHNREQEVSEISRGLKAIAKEFKVPVLSLSQLNRGVESRPDKRPKMSDLRDSGAVEQDADVVVMLYRDEYYNEASAERGIAELIIAKQRSGPTGTVRVRFDKEYTRFDNLAEEAEWDERDRTGTDR